MSFTILVEGNNQKTQTYKWCSDKYFCQDAIFIEEYRGLVDKFNEVEKVENSRELDGD